jgi:hypothetical protein
VVDADDEKAAGMRSSGGRPLGRDPGEVFDVEGDHDSSIRCREVEQSLVLPTIELAFLGGGADIVVLAERRVAE